MTTITESATPSVATAPGAPTGDCAQPCGTLYYVVPVKTKTGANEADIEQCLYFDGNLKLTDPSKLKTARNVAFIRLQEWTGNLPEVILRQIPLGMVPNTSVTLFCAVAKTLDGTSDLPNTYMSRGEVGSAAVTLSVAPQTTRGVILIFKYPAVGLAVKLIASSDPEVKNSSST